MIPVPWLRDLFLGWTWREPRLWYVDQYLPFEEDSYGDSVAWALDGEMNDMAGPPYITIRVVR